MKPIHYILICCLLGITSCSKEKKNYWCDCIAYIPGSNTVKNDDGGFTLFDRTEEEAIEVCDKHDIDVSQAKMDCTLEL